MAKGYSRTRGGASTTMRHPSLSFDKKLVLNQWVLGLFRFEKFEQLAEHLRDERLEGLDENNIHRFHNVLVEHFPDLPELPAELLLEYDQNIVTHTLRLNERRITRGEEPIVWKYFQYLTLLFTEIYLDRYFQDPQALLASVNETINGYNEGKARGDQIEPFNATAEAWSQLNKVAYWSATGSGKTLLMHANILQYQFYLQKHGRTRDLTRILLLTPNEGLSLQHLSEFQAAGIEAELFDKNKRSLFTGRAIEILDIHKLKDEMGDKTVAVEAFEGNNLVLIDEGHRGASSGETGTWLRFRGALCEKGFSFEYSATFGQAVKGDLYLTNLYARSILFNYSYPYFYRDGFGKDYQILNIDRPDEGEAQRARQKMYLVGCLLAFFQQQKVYHDHNLAFRPFNIEKPLWIFVGSSVTKTLAVRDATDTIEILTFLAEYVSDRTESIRQINHILNQGLIARDGKNLFAGRFAYLNMAGLSPEQVYNETLAVLFNATGGGALHIENLKGVTGEVALRVGENDPFGVVNVGDDAKLVKLCSKHGLITGEREFPGSLFHEINEPRSTINLLIGSRKFTEGWNSWRVSTMGLMHVGAKEGAQIIQLFGRGVRLKGFGMSLKRSQRILLPDGMIRPKDLGILETLNIFGIHAEYMEQFHNFLEEEGLPPSGERIEFQLPVIKNLGTQKLKTIRIKKTIGGVSAEFGNAFRKFGPIPTLAPPGQPQDPATRYIQKNQIILNWYPKVQAIQSSGAIGGDDEGSVDVAHLSAKHVAFLDFDRLFFDLGRFKNERGWHNLSLSRKAIKELMADQSWYRLLIPEEELSFDSFKKVQQWQEIALALLKKYTERYYLFRRHEWELPHLEYQDLAADDPNLLLHEGSEDAYYRILIETSQEEIIEKIQGLKTLIEGGDLQPWEFRGMKAIWFGQHLYQPLLYLDKNNPLKEIIEISPVPLNLGERRFIEDLKNFCESESSFFEHKELYLLRNLSKGRGVGFFEAGNFHPDFIVWVIAESRQHVAFVDPKGIRNLSKDDPKIKFFETIKEIERRLGDPGVALESFIISNTPSHVLERQWGEDKAAMQAAHILFQEEDQESYIPTMLTRIVADGSPRDVDTSECAARKDHDT